MQRISVFVKGPIPIKRKSQGDKNGTTPCTIEQNIHILMNGGSKKAHSILIADLFYLSGGQLFVKCFCKEWQPLISAHFFILQRGFYLK